MNNITFQVSEPFLTETQELCEGYFEQQPQAFKAVAEVSYSIQQNDTLSYVGDWEEHDVQSVSVIIPIGDIGKENQIRKLNEELSGYAVPAFVNTDHQY